MEITQDEEKHIFIFDEEFVHRKIRLQKEGLDSIVMLCEQADLSNLIEVAKTELEQAKNDEEHKKDIVSEYDNISSEKSPKYYIEKIKNVLRGDNSWAGRDKKIKGNTTNTHVSDNTYESFICLRPQKTRDELIIDFENEFQKLECAKNGRAKILSAIPTIPTTFNNFDNKMGNDLLKKTIEHPKLNEREKHLLSLVQDGKSEELRTIAAEFTDQKLTRCPKCHQELSKQYKSELISSIQRVLSKDVEHHQQQLENIKCSALEMDLSAFQELPHYQECINNTSVLNQIVQRNKI